MPNRPRRPASGVVPKPETEEQFDLRCIRYRNTELAAQGCGAPNCPTDTCAVARHARLILRALDVLERTHLDVRTDTCDANSS